MRRSQPKFAQLLATFSVMVCANPLVAQVQSAAQGQTVPAVTPITAVRQHIASDVPVARLGRQYPETDAPTIQPVTSPIPIGDNSSLPFQANPAPPRRPAARKTLLPTDENALAGNRLLADAVANIANHRSIAANIRHRISLFGHELVGSGTYQQMDIGDDRLLRLELKIPLDDQITSVTQICDARFLWTQRTMPDADGVEQTVVSRIDLSRLQRAVDDPAVNLSSVSTRPSLNGLLIGQGGLPQLMVELERNFDFHQVHQAILQDMPVWITSGSWKPEVLAALCPSDEKDARRVPAVLPPHIPEYVSVVLGREDLLPYQIEYRRKKSVDASVSMMPLTDRNSTSILTMELFRVEVGGAIDPNQFTFNSGNRRVIDRTTEYLSQLRSAK